MYIILGLTITDKAVIIHTDIREDFVDPQNFEVRVNPKKSRIILNYFGKTYASGTFTKNELNAVVKMKTHVLSYIGLTSGELKSIYLKTG